MADLIAVNSHFTKSHFLTQFPSIHAPYQILYPGIPLEKYHSKNNADPLELKMLTK
jgi:hypothetical protein